MKKTIKNLVMMVGLFMICSAETCDHTSSKPQTSIQVAGNNEWVRIENKKSQKIEIYWTTTGGDGTAQIGTSKDSSTAHVKNLELKKDEKITVEDFVFYRSGFIGDKADQRSATIHYRFIN